ncbi:MAG: hypothetical protein A2143_02275 [Gallionellales bacterium RBG_16_57_15]|nr:MAG: hypothetical protein A2143_02275 [Gallionellales bacterium RBG_16_57_15]
MNANWIILLIGFGVGVAPTWWVTSTHYKGVISAEHESQQRLVIEQQEKNRLALLAYAKRITDAGAQHDKDQIAVNRLAADVRRLRINFPTCPVPGTAEGGADSGEAGGILPNPVDDLFGRLQERAGSLVEEADRINIDAIRQNGQKEATD